MASLGYKLDAAQFGAQAEGTEGTAETIIAAEATMMARNISVSYDTPYHEVGALSANHAQFTGVSGGPRTTTISAEFPIKGSGTAGTAPALNPIWEALGFLGVNVGGASETYKDTVHGVAVTAQWMVAKDVTEGNIHKIHGARGSGEIILNCGEIPVLKAELMGAFNLPTEGNMLSNVAYESSVSQDIAGGAFTLDSKNLKYRNFSINIENDLVPRPDPNLAGGTFSVLIAKQRITGTMDIEAEDPATWDAFTEMTTDQEWALSLVISGGAGNILTITAPKVQITEIGVSDRDGILSHELSLAFNRSANATPYALSLAFT